MGHTQTASGFDSAATRKLADLALVTYASDYEIMDKAHSMGFEVKIFKEGDNKIAVFHNRDQIVVTADGTNSWGDVMDAACALPGGCTPLKKFQHGGEQGGLHSGWVQSLKRRAEGSQVEVMDDALDFVTGLQKDHKRQVSCAAHSKGSVAAVVAASSLVDRMGGRDEAGLSRVVTFGSPDFINGDYAKAYERCGLGEITYNIENKGDPIAVLYSPVYAQLPGHKVEVDSGRSTFGRILRAVLGDTISSHIEGAIGLTGWFCDNRHSMKTYLNELQQDMSGAKPAAVTPYAGDTLPKAAPQPVAVAMSADAGLFARFASSVTGGADVSLPSAASIARMAKAAAPERAVA